MITPNRPDRPDLSRGGSPQPNKGNIFYEALCQAAAAKKVLNKSYEDGRAIKEQEATIRHASFQKGR
jgi:hypothetical protein